jgi:hypothetical protein
VVTGDTCDPAQFLADPALTEVIDSSKPAGVLLISVLHFLPAPQADAAVAAMREWMATGNYLVISAGTSTGTDPELIRCLQDAYSSTAPVIGRTATEIEAWFCGLHLIRPGLVDVWAWRSGTLRRPVSTRARILAGVGHKTKAQWIGITAGHVRS